MTLARFQMCIGGQWVDALSGKTFESLNPALAEPWAELPEDFACPDCAIRVKDEFEPLAD